MSDALAISLSVGTAVPVAVAVGLWVQTWLTRRERARADDRAQERARRETVFDMQVQLREQIRETERMMQQCRDESRERQRALEEQLSEQIRQSRRQELRDRMDLAVERANRETGRPMGRAPLMPESQVAVALARAYAHPDNSSKVVDPTLISVMADEVVSLLQSNMQVPLPLTRPPDRREEGRLLNDMLLEQLRAPYERDPEAARDAIEDFVRTFDREDERKGRPETLAYIDGCPLYDRDIELANEWGVDVRLVLGVRLLMVKYERPLTPSPSRDRLPTEGERNLEV